MRLFKNNIALLYPNHLLLCSKVNEDYTDGDIGEMGKKLAIEVRNFINEWL